MPLTVPHQTADGKRCLLESDVLDIARRLTEGDPTLGWAGDPDLWLELDQTTDTFVVCRYDPTTGREMDVTRWSPPLTAGLLVRLRDGDSHRRGNDPVARALAADDAHEADLARQQDELSHETATRLAHAMRRDGMDVPYNQRTSFVGTGLWTPEQP